MKSECYQHLLPLLIIFILTSVIWSLNQVHPGQYLSLFLGFSLGAFFLDLDHLVFWFYLRPHLEESRLAQIAINKYDFRSLAKLLETTHEKHTSLVFHHFFFQVILTVTSFFLFTSSNNVFASSFLLALNIHLLVDEIDNYFHNPTHLQDWLFAREEKQLPLRFLKYYIGVFVFTTIFFTFTLAYSPLR